MSNNDRVTPVMAQYFAAKESAPDCVVLFRLGDFYELFFDDAVQVANALRLTLTKRGQYNGQDVPMCGVPARSLDYYVPRLLQAGYKVALCEQGEPSADGGIISRSVTRVITPGTVTEDSMLEPTQRSYLVALHVIDDTQVAVAMLDASDGDVRTMILPRNDHLPAWLHGRGAREVLHTANISLHAYSGLVYTQRPAGTFCGQNGRALLQHTYKLAHADGLAAFTEAEFAALGAVLTYLHLMHRGNVPLLQRPVRECAAQVLQIDAASRRNLELTRTIEGEKTGSVLHSIDNTATAAGQRLLAQWLNAPLRHLDDINARLDAVQFFYDQPPLLQKMRKILAALPDVPRALARLTGQNCTPRDLQTIRDAGTVLTSLMQLLLPCTLPPLLQQQYNALLQRCDSFHVVARALADMPPATFKETGVIRHGYDDTLDELANVRDNGHRTMLQFEARYRTEAALASLKLKHNLLLGYHLEAPLNSGKKLLAEPYNEFFVHKRSTTTAICFTTTALAEAERRLYDATDAAAARERSLADELCATTRADAPVLAQMAQALAVLDVCAALAHTAQTQHWQRPTLTAQPQVFMAQAVRHPCVELRLKRHKQGAFVANDCNFGQSTTLFVVTGANTGGKSTYLRQNALLIILAQMGSFVPAAQATLSVFDRIFCRAGAADDQARGRSTFAVEMIEAALILNEATPQSFVVLDELGRGTATHDGLALARACAEHLVRHNRSLTLFATHYHELCVLEKVLSAVQCLQVLVRAHKDDLICLHQVVAGAAGKSYGLVAARKAGLPPSVVQRAEHLLQVYEAQAIDLDPDTATMPLFGAG